MATLTVYPDAGTAGPSGDISWFTGFSATWATVRDATSAPGTKDILDALSYFPYAYTDVGATWEIGKTALLFDTSPINAASNISAGVISIKTRDTAGDASTSEATYPANPLIVAFTGAADLASVGDGDFDQLGAVSLCSSSPTLAAIVALGSGVYADFTLNASGLATINKTGISVFGVRASNDINNTPPTAMSYCSSYWADAAGTTNDPKLVITYTTPHLIPRIIIT